MDIFQENSIEQAGQFKATQTKQTPISTIAPTKDKKVSSINKTFERPRKFSVKMKKGYEDKFDNPPQVTSLTIGDEFVPNIPYPTLPFKNRFQSVNPKTNIIEEKTSKLCVISRSRIISNPPFRTLLRGSGLSVGLSHSEQPAERSPQNLTSIQQDRDHLKPPQELGEVRVPDSNPGVILTPVSSEFTANFGFKARVSKSNIFRQSSNFEQGLDLNQEQKTGQKDQVAVPTKEQSRGPAVRDTFGHIELTPNEELKRRIELIKCKQKESAEHDEKLQNLGDTKLIAWIRFTPLTLPSNIFCTKNQVPLVLRKSATKIT